jgi:hypothetical protein
MSGVVVTIAVVLEIGGRAVGERHTAGQSDSEGEDDCGDRGEAS